MNRQQRREMAKRKATEQKYYKQLIERQEEVDEWTLEMQLLALALALRKTLGWGQTRISRVMREFNNQLMRLHEESPAELRAELERESGIFMSMRNDQVTMRSLLRGGAHGNSNDHVGR